MERIGRKNLGSADFAAASGGSGISGCGASGTGNCAEGACTHNIPLSPPREKETEQTLQMMFDLGYVKPEEVPQIPRLAKTPSAIAVESGMTR